MNETHNENSPVQTPRGSSLAIPVAIVIGFGLIAASIYFSGNKAPVAPEDEQIDNANLSAVTPVSESDHIRGNPNAKLIIIEYSDFDCPFCKSFHTTLQAIMDEYGPNGNVAWVYRHFPLKSLHPSAAYIAEASECVAQVGGNDAFWKFTDLVFSERGINEPTNVARLPEFATIAGVNETDFETCMTSGRGKAKVEADSQNAVATGGTGTPHSIVLVGDQMLPINGAQPYEIVKQMIDGLLK